MDKKMRKAKGTLVKEAMINSALCALITALSLMFVTATFFWFETSNFYWVSFIVFGAAIIVSAPLFYFLKYRPNGKIFAKRLDELGMEERMITKEQYKDKEGFIYEAQRKNADKIFSKFDTSKLKIVASVPLIILCTTAFILGGGMTTVSGLTAAGYVKSGSEIIEDMDRANKKVFEVKYKTCYFDMGTSNNNFFFEQDENKPCGEIIGASEQVVTEGENAEEVMAVAYDGYMFYKWSDGSQDPVRIDYKIQGELTLTAIFVEVDEDGDPDKDGKPSDEDAEPDDEKDGEPGSNQDGGGDKNGENTDNKSDLRNQVLDGKTYYGGKTYEEARKDSSDKASKDGNMSSDTKKLINDYFEAIKKN